MRHSNRFFCVLIALIALFGLVQANGQAKASSRSGISAILDGSRKTFTIKTLDPAWTFEGKVHGAISGERLLKGNDRLGSFTEIAFTVMDENSYRCGIRIYDNRPVVLFQLETTDSIHHTVPFFPEFSRFPANLYMTTSTEHEFGAPPIFRLFERSPDSAQRFHSGSLLFFDKHCNSCIISPASHFMVASIVENGATVHCGLNAGIESIPAGFRESTILVVEKGINRAWETWGNSLTQLHQKRMPANDADVGLKYLGYWTDNGASYYYHYDLDKGYEGTLLALKKHFDEAHIPIRYMQLDSWWYAKGYDNPDGSIERSERRIPELPAGSWNRFGGLLEYSPSTDLFPNGLRQFHDSLELPLITHNRWISRNSPYRSNYKISGIGAVDRRWWDDVVKSILSWGVVTYEQDWLDRIYEFSPEFSKSTWAGEAFMDGMAHACGQKGLTMQYCMALPRHYLQGGAIYDNLTTIRVSGDRFEKSRWKEFFYASCLARALGIWPWCDVFMSRETPNILLATLSAGMVGIGDAIGNEDSLNISRSVRCDGVIVKPDAPIVPLDMSYLNEVNGKGILIASTFSDHGASLKTLYVFGYADSVRHKSTVIPASDLGVRRTMFLYDYVAGSGRIVGPKDTLKLRFAQAPWSYFILAPVGRSGIALVGDPDKFVTCGGKRIEKLVDTNSKLSVTILLAKEEHSVKLCGYAPWAPDLKVDEAIVLKSEFDSATHIFRIEIKPQIGLAYHGENGDSVGRVTVGLITHK